ncbi:MAG: hypothetical protein U0414_00730 [Polyangiaceae bacterium]
MRAALERAWVGVVVALLAWAVPSVAWAQKPPGGKISADCVEIIPSGATRPDVSDEFPDEGIAGFASNLVVTVRHGKGETVLPNGFKVVSQSQAAKQLGLNGFAILDPESDTAVTVETKSDGDAAVSKVTIPIVLLPFTSGNHTLKLPALPISVARADGELMTVCTSPHEIDSLDPILEEMDPKVRPNPPGRHQREAWILLRWLLGAFVLGLVILLVAAYFLRRYLKQPKPEPEIPKRVPWEVALEELQSLKSSKMLEEGKLAEYFDAVSDCVRKYLGARYGFEDLGFEGLDTTTDEMRALLRRVKPPIQHLDLIASFLDDCDLVKFARLTPSEQECGVTLDKGESIVKGTMPALGPDGKPIRALTLGQAQVAPAPPPASAKPPEDGPPTDPSPPPTEGGGLAAPAPPPADVGAGEEARPS